MTMHFYYISFCDKPINIYCLIVEWNVSIWSKYSINNLDQ